jgi:hypothetical protein
MLKFKPVLSLPILKPIFSIELPSSTLGLSSNRPAGFVSRPILMKALRNVPVVIITDLQSIRCPFSKI